MRLLAVALAFLPASAAAQAYVRTGVGYDVSRESGIADVDCARTAPPALFGCAAAVDGSPLGARGDFGASPALELGLGRRMHPNIRLELQGAWRPGLDFEGRANFLRTPGPQPVAAEGSSLAALAVAYFDFGQLGRARPFLGVGVGAARNRLGAVRYDFPGLAAQARTVGPAGARTAFAWSGQAGFGWRLSPRATLDIAYRYTDLGTMRTREGQAAVVRAAGTRAIIVAPTRAKLATEGLGASVRWGF